jgi:D-threonine aldolase
VKLLVTADHPRPLSELAAAMKSAGRSIEVLLDLDTGLRRTGVPVSLEAEELYQQIVETPGVTGGGLHLYDGQNHQTPLEERRRAVDACWESAMEFRERLASRGLPVPRIVAGGTGSFPIYAEKEAPGLELSPGTCIFHDVGYGELFPDLEFTPAALLLTRVISRPAPDRLTVDLGYKAVAADPPAGRRVRFPDLPDAKEVLHNEEHLVLETPAAARFTPGDELLAIPAARLPHVGLAQGGLRGERRPPRGPLAGCRSRPAADGVACPTVAHYGRMPSRISTDEKSVVVRNPTIAKSRRGDSACRGPFQAITSVPSNLIVISA